MTRQFAWPTGSVPVVEFDGRWRTAVRESVMLNDHMRRPWDQAETWEERCELTAQFCEGKLGASPTHYGKRDPETRKIAAELAHANRQGFLTDNSQPADPQYGQLADVRGLADEKTVRKLARLVRDTRLELDVKEPRGWEPGDPLQVYIRDPDPNGGRLLWDRLAQPDWDSPTPPAETPMPTTRPRRPADDPCTCPPDPINESENCPSCVDDFNWSYGEPDGWKNNEERIAHGEAPVYPDTEPDRGRSIPPEQRQRQEAVETQPPEPPVGTVLETSDSMGPYRIERTDLGWHIQYREGENEFGERLTSFGGRGKSWRAAWSAWGPPSGAAPFREVPPGTPPLPADPPEPPPAWVGMGPDATDQKLDTPPGAQPWTPKGAAVNEAAAGAIQGVSQVTPGGLATTAASAATGKDIKPPLASAAGASTNSSSSAGGIGMSHASEGNAQIQQAAQDIEGAMGAVQQIIESAKSAQQNLLGAAEESQHSEADTAQGALQELVSAAEELQQKAGAAKQAVEDVRL